MQRVDIYRNTAFAPLLSQNPIVYADIGSRGGFESDLETIAGSVDCVGFEPDPDEFVRLTKTPSKPWRSVRFIPVAISERDGRQRLHVTTDPDSSSLLEHDTDVGRIFNKPRYFTLEKTIEVDTLSLDEAVRSFGLVWPDYLKLNIEGMELAVLRSAPKAMQYLLAVKTEVAFVPFRLHQPIASDVDLFMREQGFALMDMISLTHWRRHGWVIHPQVAREHIPYSRGQLVQGHYLYFRSPEWIASHHPSSTQGLLKAGLIALALGYLDHAEIVFHSLALSQYLGGIDISSELRKASFLYGGLAWRKAFYRHVRGVMPFLRSLVNLIS